MSTIKKQKIMSFADLAANRRTRKNTFVNASVPYIIDTIDWESIENRLLKIKIRQMKNGGGNPAYNPIRK